MKTFIKRFLQISAPAAVIIIFLWTLFFLYAKSKEKPEVYRTATPFITDIVQKTVATGAVIPRKDIAIKPQVSGIISELFVEPGDGVSKGDRIAQIAIVPDMERLSSAESGLKMADIRYRNARINFDRVKELYEKELIAETEYTEEKSALDLRKEELEAAGDTLQLIREGIAKRRSTTTNTIIRSTIDGMVLSVNVEEGTSVIETNTFSDGTTIATVADMGEMIFRGNLDESEVGKVREDMDLVLTVGALEDVEFEARLEYISPKGTEVQGAIQFEIKAAVELREDYFIRAGYSATADIVLEKKNDVLAVKESLLQFEEGKPYVEVETAPQRFEKRYIQLGLSDGINIEVVSGLTEEDRIKVTA